MNIISTVILDPSACQSMSTRMVHGSFALCLVVCFALFNADLTTYLTVKPKLILPNSYGELSISDYTVMTWKDTAYDRIFKHLEETSDGYRLFQKMDKSSVEFVDCSLECIFQKFQVSIDRCICTPSISPIFRWAEFPSFFTDFLRNQFTLRLNNRV